MTDAFNALEVAMQEAITGTGTMEQVFATLATSQIVVPTATKVEADGSGLAPLVHNHDGVDMIVAFTDAARVGLTFHEQARYQLNVDASWLIKVIAPELGLVLFGGPDFGFRVSPEQLARLRATL